MSHAADHPRPMRLPLDEQVQALRSLALATTRPAGPEIHQELMAEVARALKVRLAMVAVFADEHRTTMRTLAVVVDGQPLADSMEYLLARSPCVEVVGKGYCFMPGGVVTRYPVDKMVADLGLDAYAAFPMNDSRGEPLGLVAALDARAIAGGDADHAEAVLKIAALRLGAELERSAVTAALRRSEASYRTIFEAAEDCIFLHDWESGRFLDANPKACSTFGYTRDELLRLSVTEVSSGVPPYTAQDAARWIALARQGRCPPFEWHRRNKDGSLHWDEVRLKPVTIDGRPHVLAVTRDITERKAAESRLRASEAQYRAIFEASADALVLWNADLRFVDVNRVYTAMYGFTRDEVLGTTLDNRLPAAVVAERTACMRAALAGQERVLETTTLRKDGSSFDVELRYLPITHLGEPHVLAIARDITERKTAEALLRASEEQYRAIFNASADALILWDSQFQRVDVNAAYERMYGWSRDEVIGRGYEYLPHPDEYARPRRELVRRALAGEACRTELQAIRKDGTRFATEVHAIPFTHRGAPHVLAIARDITERKRAEAQLRSQEERYRAIFDGSVDPMALYDRTLHMVDINEAFAGVRGCSREEILGRHWSQRIDAEEFKDLVPLIERALEGHEASTIKTVTHADGTRIDLDMRYLPVRLGGEPFALGIGRDITRRRAAEAERAALESQLRQAQKMEAIGQLTGGIAHDFNNILTSVIGYIVLAQERAERQGDANLVRQLGSAQTAAQRARELISQMLAFARRQRGDHRLIALAPVVRQTLQLLRSTLPASIVLDDAGLGEGPELPPVHADAVQLEQVLFNLCINARDAIERSGRITVRLHEHNGAAARCASCGSAVAAGRWLRLSVSDTGSGIDLAVVPRMFEPFFSTKEVGRGSGMGLAMVHGIVHEHGGHIVVDTAPGRGSSFHVLLPAADGAVDARTESAPATAGSAPLAGRVMVVEDEPMIAAFMRELLEGWGLEVVAPTDALAAARWFDDPSHDIDLLITDLTMPQMNGLELAHHVGVLRPRLPVLLYSGDTDAVDADALRRAGVRAVLAKPVDAPTLRSQLGRWLGKR